MKDLSFSTVADFVPYGRQWVAAEPALVVGMFDLMPDRLLRVQFPCGHERVIWLQGGYVDTGVDTPERLPTDPSHCDICGHLIYPDEPGRCLNCGNEVPRDPSNPVLDS